MKNFYIFIVFIFHLKSINGQSYVHRQREPPHHEQMTYISPNTYQAKASFSAPENVVTHQVSRDTLRRHVPREIIVRRHVPVTYQTYDRRAMGVQKPAAGKFRDLLTKCCKSFPKKVRGWLFSTLTFFLPNLSYWAMIFPHKCTPGMHQYLIFVIHATKTLSAKSWLFLPIVSKSTLTFSIEAEKREINNLIPEDSHFHPTPIVPRPPVSQVRYVQPRVQYAPSHSSATFAQIHPKDHGQKVYQTAHSPATRSIQQYHTQRDPQQYAQRNVIRHDYSRGKND